ncbi:MULTISPECIES: hypothetical protein [Legionella]|uniref:hypothetical protein n=1 Tax=Legionella TaxID=445 RepID=UPI000731AEE9|nr:MULTISPECIES: hypothetical protein [Legionella]CZO82820.1 Uncharacterised protein [Legionella pneumophila]
MIKDYELQHGVVLVQLISSMIEPIFFEKFNPKSNASYVINNKIGIYIKYCAKRLTPWRFTFLRAHQEEIENLKNNYNDVFIILVCHKDGIVALDWNSLKTILDNEHKEVEWIAVSRGKNKMYSITGSDGILNFKVSKSDFPQKIIEKV